jgi:hypothetical protein
MLDIRQNGFLEILTGLPLSICVSRIHICFTASTQLAPLLRLHAFSPILKARYEHGFPMTTIDISTDIFRREPARLAQLFNELSDQNSDWTDEEMASILQHQLRAPVEADLPIGARHPLFKPPQRGSIPITFGDLLRDPRPPLELLEVVKDFAMGHLRLRDKGLPRNIARVLYCASVLVARLCLGERISKLSDAKLKARLDWALEQPWLDPSMRDLFCRGRTTLNPA